ncbi:hypothetical protein MJO29_006132 [Puccinia striiformis f. sp. tritici]|nr:hypothetical protein MJO29_006132 [Puccinia striiformis f. sp. tritici]
MAKETSLNKHHPNLLRTMSQFFGYIILRRFFWFIVFVLFAGELDIEAKRTYSNDPRPTLAQKLRRSQNAAINLSARARLRANHPDQPDQSNQISQDVQVSNMDMANNPYDPHQHNQEAGNSSDEGEVDLCMCMYFQLSAVLFQLTGFLRNSKWQPDDIRKRVHNWTPSYPSTTLPNCLGATTKQKLLDLKLALLPVKAMKKIIKSIKQRSRQLKKDAEGISDLPRDGENRESRLRLLLWKFKQKLYIQAVQLRAERQPLMGANKTGPRVGTDRKEEMFKSMRKREPAFKKLLNKYNKLYSEFSKTFPTHPAANSPLHPVDYDDFSK